MVMINSRMVCPSEFSLFKDGMNLLYPLIILTLLVSAICRPGEYSINGGVDPCLDCPVGTYQDNYQRTKCHACPAGSTTLRKGSSSADDCNCK